MLIYVDDTVTTSMEKHLRSLEILRSKDDGMFRSTLASATSMGIDIEANIPQKKVSSLSGNLLFLRLCFVILDLSLYISSIFVYASDMSLATFFSLLDESSCFISGT